MLGGGYLLLVFAHSPNLPMPTGQLLHAIRVRFPALASPTVASSVRIIETLERPIPMEFPRPTPLSEVLEYLREATTTPGRPGLPIYLDPIGLQEAERTPDSTIAIDLRGVPLKVTLWMALKRLGMDYVVEDGVLRITDETHEEGAPFYEIRPQSQDHLMFPHREAILALSSDLADPYLIVGHCLLALLMAGFGALMGPILAGALPRAPA